MSQSYRSRGSSSKGSRRKSGGSRITVLIVVLVLLVGVFAGIIALLNPGGSSPVVIGTTSTPGNSGNVSADTDKFYGGVFVDDISLGGLTMEQAKTQIEAKQKEYAGATGVTVTKDATTVKFLVSDTTYTFDTDAVLAEAWKQGREGTEAERSAAIKNLPGNPVKLTTTVTVDPSALEQKVRELTAPYLKAATDATFIKYDVTKPIDQRMVFTDDVPGEQVDADALWAAVKKEFEERTFGTVTMQVVPLQATITKASLLAELQLIGTFESEIKNYTKERRKNIELASAAVSGKILLPGETFSVNEATGPRTVAKGYQKAPVDINGVEDVGLGGGVCQVSSALYNAAIAAGPNRIEIKERNHHSLVSGYMKRGTDATVDYPAKDLKFKNISDKPMLIIAYYDYDKTRKKYDYHMKAEIYGVPDPEGAKYVLEGVTVTTIKGDATKQRTQASNALKPGETKLIPAHNGYVVDVYLVKTAKDGTVTKTKLYRDTYPADCNVLTYYADDGVPTPSPSPTPTPDATVAPPPPTPAPTQAPTEAPAA